MKILKNLQSRFYKTKIFKGLVNPYVRKHSQGAVKKEKEHTQVVLKQLEEKHKGEIIKATKEIEEKVPQLVQEELSKADTMKKNEARRYAGVGNINRWQNPDRKPGSGVPFSFLRRMAVAYPIARACINRRTRQITQLSWDVTTIDEEKDEEGYATQIAKVKNWLKQPTGHKTRFREMMTTMIDDILTIDAISFEFQRRRGGEFMYLIPVDPATIVLRVTEQGGTPVPPEIAYAQFIGGQKMSEFTTDEMLYEMMSNRSFSPYGVAPLESLVLQCESALRGTLFNLNYLRENNVPEGFITLPEDVAANKDQIEEWQQWFDSMLAGDQRTIHRLKILPGGAEYVPAKKMEDMSFERFELWLLQQTCAVFEVPPQEIGITYQVNKSTGDNQQEIAREKGLYPLANFIKEILDDIIQIEMRMPNLQFKWTNINPVDRKEEVEIAEKEIGMGALSVDEYRIERGLEPIGLTHYVKTGTGPLMLKDILNPPKEEETVDDKEKKDPNKKDDPSQKSETTEIRAWRKAIYKDLELGRKLRKHFPSDFISKEYKDIIQEGLEGVNSKYQAKLLFDQFLDPEVSASMKLLKMAENMRQLEHAQYTQD